MYVTSSTLDGVCKELKAEDGDADQARQLSACAAWVQDQEEGTDELEEFVMEQVRQLNDAKNWFDQFSKIPQEKKPQESDTDWKIGAKYSVQ